MSYGEFFSMARKKRCEMTKEELDRVRQQDRDRQRRRREQLHGNEENIEKVNEIRRQNAIQHREQRDNMYPEAANEI